MNALLSKNLITTKEAGELSGYSSDYLARLARSGKIIGRMVGHSWLVDQDSLERFISVQDNSNVDRARTLARARVEEYNAHRTSYQTRLSSTHKIVPTDPIGIHMDSVHIRPADLSTSSLNARSLVSRSFAGHFYAFTMALAIVFTGAFVARTDVVPNVARHASLIATETALGFAQIYGDIPARIIARLEAPRVAVSESRTRVAREIAAATSNIDDTFASFSARGGPAFGGQTPIFNFQSRLNVAMLQTSKINSTEHSLEIENSKLKIEYPSFTLADITAFASALTSPENFGNALANGYRAVGGKSYDAIRALAGAIQYATHAAIRADVALVYDLAAAGPASARVTVALIGNAGDILAREASAAPRLATELFLKATALPATLAPALASTVFDVAYTTARRGLAAVDRITSEYLAFVHGAGEASYIGVTGAVALADITRRAFVAAPKAIEDSYLGTLGKTALGFDTFEKLSAGKLTTGASQLASVLSAGEHIALVMYQTVNTLFDSARSALAFLFGPAGPSSNIAAAPSPSPAATEGTATTTTTRVIAVTNYPTYTTVVRGITQADMEQSFIALRTGILSTVAGMILPVANQSITNLTTIQQVNMIQDLSNLIVRNGDFRGGTFANGSVTNASSVSATTGTFGSLTAGATSITSTLDVSGTVTAPNFIATSTTATSTFAGSLNVDNGGFVYATSTRSVGIGTTSPYRALSVSGSGVFTGGDVFASTFTATSTITSAATTTALNFISSNSGYVGAPAYTFSGNLTSGFWSPGTNLLAWSTNALERMRIDASGRLGIGTTSPDALLSLFQNVNGLPIISAYRNTDTAPSGDFINYKTNSGTTLFRVDNSGNILAGGIINTGSQTITSTSTPQFRVQYDASNEITTTVNSVGASTFGINGSAPSLSFTPQSNSVNTFNFTNAASNSILSIDTTNQRVGIGTTTPGTLLSIGGNGTGINFVDGTSATSTFAGNLNVSGNINLNGALLQNNAPFVGSQWTTSGSTIYYSTGLVGIGTSTPAARLDIAGTLGSQSALFNISSTTATNIVSSLFNVQASGNVGIGTTGPGSLLNVFSTNNSSPVVAIFGATTTAALPYPAFVSQQNTAIQISSNSVSGQGGPWLILSNDTAGSNLTTGTTLGMIAFVAPGTASAVKRGVHISSQLEADGSTSLSANLQFLTTNAGSLGERMRITAAGNVGIGTTTPGTLLSIGGNGTGINFVDGTSATSTFAGNLNVSGNINLNGSLLQNNAPFVGSQWTTSGSTIYYNTGNVGIGTTGPASRLDITNSATSSAIITLRDVIGGISMEIRAGTSTLNNTFVGRDAGRSNTTGFRNVANGRNALFSNTTGNYNTAIGDLSLFSNTTGTENTANGSSALYWNTIGVQNVASGDSAIFSNTTGSFNTANGTYVLYYNTSATSSTAIGYEAGSGTANYSNQGGVYLGYRSGYSAGTGSDYNTLLGFQSGYDVTTGTNNTILGQFVTTGGGITTGSNNILIGKGVRNGLSQTGSNQLNIGNLIFATGLGADATLSTGNVGIGTTTPGSLLSLGNTGNDTINISATATSTFGSGLNIRSGCYAVNGVCVGGSSVTGTTGQLAYFSGLDTAVGTSTLFITPAGNVGIGTTTPNWLLQVAGTRPSITLSDTSAGVNLKHWMFSSMGGNFYIGTSTDAYATSSPAALTILNSGFMGLGTSTPYSLLSVEGQIVGRNFVASLATATSTFAGGFDINSGAFQYDVGANQTSIERLAMGAVEFEADAGALSWIDMPFASTTLAAGTIQSYTAQLASNQMLQIYGEADGAGALQRARVVVGTSTAAQLASSNIPDFSLIVGNGILCVDNGSGTCSSAARTAGSIYAKSSSVTAVDLAENYPTKDATLAPGDLVMLDPANPVFVKKYDPAASSTPRLIGVVSTNPGILLGGFSNPQFANERQVAVALSGRVPVKVSTENGPIAVGDKIAPSAMPGLGALATTSGMTVGIALEPYAGAGVGTIDMFVNTAYNFVDSQFSISDTGVVGAKAFSVPFDIASSTLPSAVLTADGKGVDIYKMATFTLSEVQALAAKLDAQEVRIASLEARMTALESGAVSSGSLISLSTTSLASALESFGVFIRSGLAQFGSLVADRFIAATNSAGTSSAGTVTITAGNTVAEVANEYVTPTTKVFVTFSSPVTGSWYVSDKTIGGFKVVLSTAQAADASFDYFLVQTEGQVATSTPVGISEPAPEPAPDSTSSPQAEPAPSGDTTAPVVTLIGAAALEIAQGSAFTDPGATAVDAVDGDLTATIVVTGSVDTAVVDLYTLTYSATDAAGNVGSVSRVVTVTATP